MLEHGRVVACVAAEAATLHGCSVSPLGLMRYRMVASPAFARQWFPEGFERERARLAPVLVFDRKDPLQADFLLRHLGLPQGAYPIHYVPASDAFIRAIGIGLGYGMLPLEQCGPLLADGSLVDLAPGLYTDVPLYWHAWRIQPPRLERMGAALIRAARAVLQQA
jgi:LysR family transcriptional regulator (chromosome initiation inhibitor)